MSLTSFTNIRKHECLSLLLDIENELFIIKYLNHIDYTVLYTETLYSLNILWSDYTLIITDWHNFHSVRVNQSLFEVTLILLTRFTLIVEGIVTPENLEST